MIDPGEITISHHGVKGQRWGVKRKGSAVSSGLMNKKPKNDLSAQSAAREASWQGKYLKRSSMSTRELQANVNRLNLENQFKKAVSEATPAHVSAGKKFINSVAGKVFVKAGTDVATSFAKKGLESALKAAAKVAANAAKAAQVAKLAMSDDEGFVISHHGVKGQKWGQRRIAKADARFVKKAKSNIAKGKYSKLLTNRYIDAHNNAAHKSSAAFDKFNADWDKKHKSAAYQKKYKNDMINDPKYVQAGEKMFGQMVNKEIKSMSSIPLKTSRSGNKAVYAALDKAGSLSLQVK